MKQIPRVFPGFLWFLVGIDCIVHKIFRYTHKIQQQPEHYL